MASGNAIDDFIRTKERNGFRPSYITSLRQYLNLFARGREKMSVSDFTVKHIEDWFTLRKEAPSTQASNLGRLTSFFAWCKRRGYVIENPCHRVEHVRLQGKTPKILTADQMDLLLTQMRKAHPQFLLWLVLSLFVGVRRDELARMNLAEIKKWIKSGVLIIDGEASKVRRRRIIELNARQKRWILWGLRLRGRLPVPKITVRRRLREMRAWLSFNHWPQNVLRHTALSVLLAECRDSSRVAHDAGNSPKILLTHYNGLVTPSELKKFLKLRP